MLIGDRIKQRRQELKLTQPALGKAVGVSRAAVSLWEKNENEPKGVNLQNVAKELRCSADWLIYGKGTPSDEVSSNTEETAAGVALIPRDSIIDFINGRFSHSETAGPKSSLVRDGASGGARTFAYAESSEGMSPKIEPGDIVYVDPEQKEITTGPYLYETDIGVVVGIPKATPRGVMLHFLNREPGWEPIPAQPDSCIGKVIAWVPNWT